MRGVRRLLPGRVAEWQDGKLTVRPYFTLEERIALIDEVVEDFGARLRNILMRSVRPDLSWNTAYGFEEWPDPADSIVAAHAPGIWYAGKGAAETRRRRSS